MNEWTHGYVAEIDYTYGYYQELNPHRVKLAFLSAGLVVPEFVTACELGFGQGLSANIHAAASVCSWHGTDFNPSQAGFAQELATVSGANAHLYADAFDEFAKRDMPDFDYIGLHGIWSWISDESRQVIVDFIRQKLKVGGILYVSYNALPGFGTLAPIRNLMTEHAKVIGADGVGIVSRIDDALEFTEKLLATNPLFARANPLIYDKFKQISGENRNYLAHEYFNRDWHPMHFATMAEWLEPAKLTFACSAHYQDYIEAANLTPEQQTFLAEIHDPMFKQTVRDFIVNQKFRRDYWVKGARRLTSLDQAQGLRDQRLLMTAHRANVPLVATGFLGEANLKESIYAPVLDLMADHKVRSVAQIEYAVNDAGITFAQLIQVVLVLCGNGTLSAVQDDTAITKAKKHTDKLNNHLMLIARSNSSISFLASPVTGGGVEIDKFHQLFMLALKQGLKNPEDWARFVVQITATHGQKIALKGKTLETTEEQLVELTKLANEFALKSLPIYKALQIS